MDETLVGETWDRLADRHAEFFQSFYDRLFQRHPEYVKHFTREMDIAPATSGMATCSTSRPCCWTC